MLSRIKKWYEGEFIPYENSPDSPVFFFGGYYKRHWAANLAHKIVDFSRAEYKWLTGVLLAIITIIVSIVYRS